ncbi:MAG: hypothetical protein AAFY10_01150 [Pseudomonadota bacterium]
MDRAASYFMPAEGLKVVAQRGSAALQAKVMAVLGDEYAAVRLRGEAWTLEREGRVIGVGGIEPIWPGRAALWSYQADLSLGDWKRVLRLTRRRLAGAAFRRIEATADVDRPGAGAFLARLGFCQEGRLRAYGPGGETVDMWARVAR